MYKLTRRKNLIPFLVLAGLGLAASVGVPTHFPDQVFEVPTLALLPAEIALVMILSVIIFENATPPELVRISFTMLAMTMFSGAISNVIAKSSQTLPDATLLLNWVQLICMNITGLVGTTAYYQTRADVDSRPLPSAARDAAKAAEHHDEDGIGAAAGHLDMDDPASGESAKDILDKLDVSRIMRLEKSLKTNNEAAQGNVSLESLFADESSSAAAAKSSEETNKAPSLADLLGGDDDSGFSLDEFATTEIAAMVPPPPAVMARPAALPEYAAETTEMPAMAVIPELALPPAAVPTPAPEPASAALTPAPEPTLATPVNPAPVVPAATAGGGKLFDDVSGDIDDIFSGLAAPDAQQDFTPEKLADIKPAAPEPAPAPAATKGDGKLFDDVDGDIEDIFASLAPADAQKEVGDLVSDFLSDDLFGAGSAPASPSPTPVPSAGPAPSAPKPAAPAPSGGGSPREVKEFGRLSVTTTAKQDPVAPGTLKTIGQMLLDTQAVENIIKRSEGTEEGTIGKNLTTARIVSASRGADIQTMLDEVANFPGIDGCLVIGKDGLLIGATQSLGMMRDVLGVLALGIHSTTNLGTKKIDMGELRQSIMLCGQKVSILTQIGIGVLATFCDQWDLARIDLIIQHINSTVVNSEASGGADLPVDLAPAAGVPSFAQAPAPMPAAPPMPEPEVAVSIADAKGGLLSVSDDEIGDLFANVVADPTTANDSIGSHTPAATMPVVPSADGKPPLLSVSDDEMSDIFDSLLDGMPNDVAMDFAPSEGIGAPAPVPSAVAEDSIVDSILGDAMFGDDLGGSEPAPASAPVVHAAPVVEASAPVVPAPAPVLEVPAAAVETPAPAPVAEAPVAAAPVPAPAPVAEAPKKPEPPKQQHQVKEFGRLSASATAQQQSEGSIKAIGRQLIDVQAVENIIKSGEKRDKIGSGLTTARVISAARGEGIKALLTKIDGTPGVQGSLIVGNDGLVIASTLTGGMDKDLLGALCTAMHSHTDLAAKKVQLGKLRQIIFHAEDRTTVLTGVAVGVLCVFVDNHDVSKIDGLLNAIETTVRG